MHGERSCGSSFLQFEEDGDVRIPAVFGLAILEIWAAVPAGIALGVPPMVVWLLTVAGSLLGVAVVAFGGGALRA